MKMADFINFEADVEGDYVRKLILATVNMMTRLVIFLIQIP